MVVARLDALGPGAAARGGSSRAGPSAAGSRAGRAAPAGSRGSRAGRGSATRRPWRRAASRVSAQTGGGRAGPGGSARRASRSGCRARPRRAGAASASTASSRRLVPARTASGGPVLLPGVADEAEARSCGWARSTASWSRSCTSPRPARCRTGPGRAGRRPRAGAEVVALPEVGRDVGARERRADRGERRPRLHELSSARRPVTGHSDASIQDLTPLLIRDGAPPRRWPRSGRRPRADDTPRAGR